MPSSAHDGLSPLRTVRQAYEHLEESGAIGRDPAQMEVVEALDRLLSQLAAKQVATKSSALGWLFARKRPAHEPVRGLYIHGEVGRGKTMLMDLFFSLIPVQRKRRVHFNDFMTDVHDRIQKHREDLKRGRTKETDPIAPVAKALAEQAWVLCFDEFTVTDIADAMVLSRLFSALFAEGVVLVATSNVAPRDLYRDGLNRGLFEPFIAILERHAKVLNLDGPTDHRRRQLEQMKVYISPLGAEADAQMDAAWATATAGRTVHADKVELKGREIIVPRAAGTVARFSFAELCGAPLGARDYLAIAARYDTLFLDHIPVMAQDRRNEAKRFILLVDTLYDNRVRLVASAESLPETLYRGTVGTEKFEFIRTASRLTEMQSRDWLEGAHQQEAAQ